jgi:hypothetical protein
MKNAGFRILFAVAFISISLYSQAQKSDKIDKFFQKGDNSINKLRNILAVFQPYLLKARQIYYEGKQLVSDVKKSKQTLKQYNNSDNQNQNNTYNNTTYTNNSYTDTSSNEPTYSNNTSNTTYSNNNTYSNTNYSTDNSSNNSSIQNYLPNQNLPVNNPATVNNDGTGNWGNQNNALYGNCLDVMTGTVMGLGEAESNPKSVDVIFVAANDSYQLWTPDYARNEVAAQYTSSGTYESVSKWSDVNETEIASTRITLGQFDQIQNNSQILNAVKNAQGYSSSITEFNKLDGKVYAVKAELEDRTVYGLIAVVKQIGTNGSNGYLKIKIKSQGIGNDQINTAMYQR